MLAVLGGWSLFTVPQGLGSRRIQPNLRGLSSTYDRLTSPKRFWASIAWKAALGMLLVGLAFLAYRDAAAQRVADRCNSTTDAYSPLQKFAACDELTRLRPTDSDAFVERGLILLDGGAFEEAAADFSRAHELDPENPWPLANRGLAFAWEKNPAAAHRDFDAVRAIDSSNPVMLRGEAILKINDGDTQGAVDQLTASMVRDQDNLWALRKRSELYWELGEVEKSRRDDQSWLQHKKALSINRR